MTALYIIILICAAYLIGMAATRRRIRNAETEWLTNCADVVPVFPMHPFDYTVEQRAENLRQAFTDHGNQFGPVVVAYYFGMTLDGTATTALQYAQFLDACVLDYQARRERHVTDRAKKDNAAAAAAYGGQVFTIRPINNKDFLN